MGNFSDEAPKSSRSHARLLLSLCLPVLEELLQTGIGQWMFEQCLEDAVRHRADVTACQCRLDNVLRMADAGD